MGAHNREPPWLIMEWIEKDLASVNLTDHEIKKLLLHVSKGLAYAHAKGFTHRDLKQENILVQLDKGSLVTAKIADFGTTKYDLSGKMETYVGSSVYMAPEFWKQELAYTNAVDMWSFGVMAVELLNRREARLEGWDPRFPPSKTSHQDWIRGTLLKRAAGAPEAFEPLLRRLLSETPKDRLTAKDCENWLQNNAQAHSSTTSHKRAASLLDGSITGLEHSRTRSKPDRFSHGP